ncbi:hypothetical protein HNV08_11790 [Winogradskyella eckloniae]|uniref:hypothetical protein n=1 Tax=Winogradskyella eckloniae TaxID=1089306 RepID=UPI001565D548|nr:hypothetical protein [Winogradskyella eckloniae]NRD20732.1 hypothetical protein [Winogradskyella eckloniae]
MKSILNITFLASLLFLCTSCHFNKGHFVITNASDFKIDSLAINPNTKQEFISLDQGESMAYSISMTEAKSDGSYFISYKNHENSNKISKSFGYYSNGHQIEDEIHITVLNDTVLIKSKFDKTY